MTISERISKIGTSPTLKITAKSIELRANGIDIINLSVGEPDFPTPDNIKKAAIQAINNNKTKYTNNAGIVELRDAITKKLYNDNGLKYGIDDIIVSTGAKQSLFNLISTVVNKGDEVIIPAPYWVSYPQMVILAEGTPVILQTKEENDFKISIPQLEQSISDKTKVLILCNPSNPTGTAYNKNELMEIADILKGKDILIISDEIYEKLVYDNFNFTSFASLSNEVKEKTVIINGVSKAYAMTGWRIGFAAGPKNLITGMKKIQSHSTSNACSISQYAALEAFSGPQDSINKTRDEFEKRRNFFCEGLNVIDGIFTFKPKGAFYIFPNVKKVFGKTYGQFKIENSYDLSMYLLDKAQVAVVPGSAFGAEGYLRISYAASMETLKEGLNRIETALKNLK
jgi:aspartate/methionine/tyrosine aminotransferase